MENIFNTMALWTTSFTAIIIALTSLCVALGKLFVEMKKLIKLISPKKAFIEKIKFLLSNIPKKSLIGILLTLVVAGTIFAVRAGTTNQRINDTLTSKAWEALNSEQHNNAIKYATRCIREFGGSALKDQTALKQANEPEPPEGRASKNLTKAEKKKIFDRGLLNNVATCWYIKGRALEELGKRDEAIAAYLEAESLTYARTYDPDFDEFWSPAEKAKSLRMTLE